MSVFSRFFGSSVSNAASYAIGGAAQAPLDPVLRSLVNAGWRVNPSMPADVGTIAQLVAEQMPDVGDGQHAASATGFGPDVLALYVEAATNYADLATAMLLWRRGDIGDGQLESALRKQAIGPDWIAEVKKLKVGRLDSGPLANAVQQGFVPNPDLLPTSPPTAPGKVPFGGQVDLDVLAEFLANGLDAPRAKVLAELAGLPPGPMEMLEMLRRSIIDESDFRRGVAAGHTKTEWADAYLALQQPVLSAATAATLRLKGWITADESHAIGGLSGFSPAQMDLLYQAGGRPPAPGQMTTAVARGFATEADFKRAIVESDIRPEWAQLLFDIRFHYPSLFFTKAAVAGGEVDDATATEWLVKQSYEPAVAAKLVASFHKAKVSGVKDLTRADVLLFYQSRYISTAQATTDLGNLGYAPDEVALLLEHADAQRLKRFLDAEVSRVHARYVGWKIDRQTAQADVAAVGIPASAVSDMLQLWDVEREADRPILTAAQVIALLHQGHITPLAAHDSLVLRGYSDVSAQALVSHYAPLGAPGSLQAILDTTV